MAEDQKIWPNQTHCWQCGEIVYKGIKNCPKCGAEAPAISIATQHKIVKITLLVGSVLLIAGIIIGLEVVKMLTGQRFEVGWGDVVGHSFGFGILAIFLICVGLSGLISAPFGHFKVKKREQQIAARRKGQ